MAVNHLEAPRAHRAAHRRHRLSLPAAARLGRPYPARRGAAASAITCASAPPSTTPSARPSTRWRSSSGLPYPGGPQVEREAARRRSRSASTCPRPMHGRRGAELLPVRPEDRPAARGRAHRAADAERHRRPVRQLPGGGRRRGGRPHPRRACAPSATSPGHPTALVVAGGVAANQAMRRALQRLAAEAGPAPRRAAARPVRRQRRHDRLGRARTPAARPRRRHDGAGARPLAARCDAADEAGAEGLSAAPPTGSPDAASVIVGAGAWGTALANVAAARGPRRRAVDARLGEQAQAHRERRARTPASCRALRLHDGVRPTADLAGLAGADSSCSSRRRRRPAHGVGAAPASCRRRRLSSLCAKGIERAPNLFLSDVVREVRPGAPVGGSVRAELRRATWRADCRPRSPSRARDGALAAAARRRAVGRRAFRVYHGTDVRGVEIGGAAKNVLAIACGAVAGTGPRRERQGGLDRARLRRTAALRRAPMAAEAETLMGLSGLGDLVLTCSSAQSRNFAFGERLGRGHAVREASRRQAGRRRLHRRRAGRARPRAKGSTCRSRRRSTRCSPGRLTIERRSRHR